MKKVSNTDAELKKSVAYKKACNYRSVTWMHLLVHFQSSQTSNGLKNLPKCCKQNFYDIWCATISFVSFMPIAGHNLTGLKSHDLELIIQL